MFNFSQRIVKLCYLKFFTLFYGTVTAVLLLSFRTKIGLFSMKRTEIEVGRSFFLDRILRSGEASISAATATEVTGEEKGPCENADERAEPDGE